MTWKRQDFAIQTIGSEALIANNILHMCYASYFCDLLGLVVWPCLEIGRSFRLKECLVLLWCLLVLTINSLVFDYRDVAGDAAAGTGTIPVRLGRRNTIYLLAVLVAALAGVSGWLASAGLTGPSMPAVLASGGAGLLLALVSQLRPMTISVLADLFLMLPAVVQFFT